MSGEYIVQRRMKQQKLRRKARRGSIALRRFYKFIRLLFILCILYSVYRLSILHYWYFPTDIYNNKSENRIEILGNNIVSNSKIISEMKKINLPKEPLYKINPSEIMHRLENLAPVKHAYIRRYWFPARLTIMIEEVTPAITIAPSETAPAVAAFALTGELIGREYLPLKTETGTVKVLSYGTKGDDYEKWDINKIKEIYEFSQVLENYSGEKIQYLDMRNPLEIYVLLHSLKLGSGGLQI
ncbi:MAG: FtsQ-type POTRA domain-containing protein, partial [Candidatus Gastranaerophilales bacterium]|nr:FtsQ-type POTRA domain-containing protein [Candidatus Gastranaerophilales bacterium]